jgi:hypothetical protein
VEVCSEVPPGTAVVVTVIPTRYRLA